MEQLLQGNELQLIYKYQKYYIRVTNTDGTYTNNALTVFDIPITTQEAQAILDDPMVLREVYYGYSQRLLGVYSKDWFIENTIAEYLIHVIRYTQTDVTWMLKRLAQHPDIRLEFYHVIMSDAKYTPENPIRICGHTAAELVENSDWFNYAWAYRYMMLLRDDPNAVAIALKYL